MFLPVEVKRAEYIKLLVEVLTAVGLLEVDHELDQRVLLLLSHQVLLISNCCHEHGDLDGSAVQCTNNIFVFPAVFL